MSFPKILRLQKRSQFLEILKSPNKKLIGKYLSLKYRLGKEALPKLGISASCHFGKAHERNLFKRRIREIFRTSLPLLPANCELHILPRKWAKTTSAHSLKEEFLFLVTQIQKP